MFKKLLLLPVFCLFFSSFALEFKNVIQGDQRGIEAYENDRCVGRIFYHITITGSAYISKLHVETDMQKKAIGSKLMRMILEELKSLGIQFVSLIPYSFTKEIPYEKLIAFYERFGFSQFPQDRHWMTLEIKDN